MNLDNLALLEFKHSFSSSELNTLENSRLLTIKTCQRQLVIGSAEDLQALPTSLQNLARMKLTSTEAYAHLLRFSCGLESQVKGETDVFGQVKTAVQEFLANPMIEQDAKPFIQSVFLKAFEDTKEIRAIYLQGIGGNSYGALARRLLDCKLPGIQFKNVLVIGAGQIAKRVVPYFAPNTESAPIQLTVWNRSAERVEDLNRLLHRNKRVFYTTSYSANELESFIQKADLILVAVPANSMADQTVANTIKNHQVLLHLGAQSDQLNHYLATPNTFSLTDLFALEKEQSEVREKQVNQAMTACHHRAMLRKLSKSIVPHGWEDLALFA